MKNLKDIVVSDVMERSEETILCKVSATVWNETWDVVGGSVWDNLAAIVWVDIDEDS